MITGSVSIDLRDAKPDLACLPLIPTGVRVLLDVGALSPDPHVVRLVAEHGGRLHIDVRGSEHVLRAWVEALRTGAVPSGAV